MHERSAGNLKIDTEREHRANLVVSKRRRHLADRGLQKTVGNTYSIDH
jgi:hypothetical protein